MGTKVARGLQPPMSLLRPSKAELASSSALPPSGRHRLLVGDSLSTIHPPTRGDLHGEQ